jgi:hypothetical protein
VWLVKYRGNDGSKAMRHKLSTTSTTQLPRLVALQGFSRSFAHVFAGIAINFDSCELARRAVPVG